MQESRFKNKENLMDIYTVELGEEGNFFQDEEDLYLFYTIRDKKTGMCVNEGISLFDKEFEYGVMDRLSPLEQRAYALAYLQEHVADLLEKKNVYDLHPYVRDLVLSSVESESGMFFVECYEEMTEADRELYTQETLDLLREEVKKEGLSDYIEVDDLFSYRKDGDQLMPTYDPVITVYMGVGTLFDLSEKRDLTRDAIAVKSVGDKPSLQEQIHAASTEVKADSKERDTELER